MDEIPRYVESMLDESKIAYDTPELEPILKNTYGVLVYQEQVMQTVKALAGFTSGQADLIRKAMGEQSFTRES
jgi:DNA polymerase-3 subunit alpha